MIGLSRLDAWPDEWVWPELTEGEDNDYTDTE